MMNNDGVGVVGGYGWWSLVGRGMGVIMGGDGWYRL